MLETVKIVPGVNFMGLPETFNARAFVAQQFDAVFPVVAMENDALGEHLEKPIFAPKKMVPTVRHSSTQNNTFAIVSLSHTSPFSILFRVAELMPIALAISRVPYLFSLRHAAIIGPNSITPPRSV